MKLYKFRPLGRGKYFSRLKRILNTGEFHCSKIWDLNDPMEGVFSNSSYNRLNSQMMYSEKNAYKICSFSSEAGLKNSLLWGYYANGFKGVAIEVEIEDRLINTEFEGSIIKEIAYLPINEFRKNIDDVILIISRKLEPWKHECEFRFIIKSRKKKHKIGKITGLYLGNPYGDLINTQEIVQHSDSLKDYYELKNKILELTNNMDFLRYDSYFARDEANKDIVRFRPINKQITS
jgi:hypothetical protein